MSAALCCDLRQALSNLIANVNVTATVDAANKRIVAEGAAVRKAHLQCAADKAARPEVIQLIVDYEAVVKARYLDVVDIWELLALPVGAPLRPSPTIKATIARNELC
jgi:hypothetical protein